MLQFLQESQNLLNFQYSVIFQCGEGQIHLSAYVFSNFDEAHFFAALRGNGALLTNRGRVGAEEILVRT